MTVRVLRKGPSITAECQRCRSQIEFEPEDAGFLPFGYGPGGSFRINCSVCKGDVFKTVLEAA